MFTKLLCLVVILGGMSAADVSVADRNTSWIGVDFERNYPEDGIYWDRHHRYLLRHDFQMTIKLYIREVAHIDDLFIQANLQFFSKDGTYLESWNPGDEAITNMIRVGPGGAVHPAMSGRQIFIIHFP